LDAFHQTYNTAWGICQIERDEKAGTMKEKGRIFDCSGPSDGFREFGICLLLTTEVYNLKLRGKILYKENMWGEESGPLYSGLFLIKYIKLLLRRVLA
jgi:hypothetical protein